MQHANDVRDAYVRFLADVSSGSDAWADRFACTEDGASLIGTDDTEWYQGGAMRAAWTELAHAFRATGMRIVASDPVCLCRGADRLGDRPANVRDGERRPCVHG